MTYPDWPPTSIQLDFVLPCGLVFLVVDLVVEIRAWKCLLALESACLCHPIIVLKLNNNTTSNNDNNKKDEYGLQVTVLDPA